MKKLALPAINIQYPISREIISGKKTIETRTYPLPQKYSGADLYLVETPGIEGDFSARAIAIICFEGSFEYESAQHFYNDKRRHKVDENSPWKWQQGKNKWGWKIKRVQVFDKPVTVKARRGIVFTQSLSL